MATDCPGLWGALNERQRHFLAVMYQRECDLAAYYQSQRAMFDPKKKGAEGRWMRHWMRHNGDGGLARALNVGAEDEAALRNNQGRGATYKALEERGYLHRRWTPAVVTDPFGRPETVNMLDVRLTARGRKLCTMTREREQALRQPASVETPPEQPARNIS